MRSEEAEASEAAPVAKRPRTEIEITSSDEEAILTTVQEADPGHVHEAKGHIAHNAIARQDGVSSNPLETLIHRLLNGLLPAVSYEGVAPWRAPIHTPTDRIEVLDKRGQMMNCFMPCNASRQRHGAVTYGYSTHCLPVGPS